MNQGTRMAVPENPSYAVKYTIDAFTRDFQKVFGATPKRVGTATADLVFARDETGLTTEPETFSIRFIERSGHTVLVLTGADDLGLIYGIYHLSETILGVDPFWFWADREPTKRGEIEITAVDSESRPHRVRYRGWFVNDEVCLIGWTDTYPPPRPVWETVFETLLRLGGNLVIPGTDLPREADHCEIAAEMGLYLTHHHAEPLGSEMFFRAFPDCDASYERHPELFERLWTEAIMRQRDKKIIWTLGFRGQGDYPFWEVDPQFDTPERRGALITRAVRRQYDLVQSLLPGAPCLTYLYGEISELYRDGYIDFPPGVTKVWSDNGYGRMVSRRHQNHNVRTPSLPRSDESGPHGIYFHATFHDLQASSHLVMMPVSTSLLASELTDAFEAGADTILLVNCGNVRPHVFTLDLIAKIWRGDDGAGQNAAHDFASRYFGSAADRASECLIDLIASAIAYGPHEDDRAGDEFYHHPARVLVGHVMRGESVVCAQALIWATGEMPFKDQVAWFAARSAPAIERFAALERQCERTLSDLEEGEATFFRDLLLFQVRFHRAGATGLAKLCQSINHFLEGQYPQAFVLASQAVWSQEAALRAMTETEHGKWRNFFRADWLTNVRITHYSINALRTFYRQFGDNPDYFLWHKQFLMPESEKKIYLENTHRNPPSDDDLAKRLEHHFQIDQG
ncbi:MAG: glycosyl hydrolase 115 family protein [Devosia sp.]